MKRKTSLLQVLVLLIGVVLGNLIGKIAEGISALQWLAFGQSFGLEATTLDLGLIQLTFGFHITITIAAILGLIFALILCRYLN